MKTILRTPYEVSTNTTSIRKATNYKNQMKFTGIKQDDNIYAIDQDSSRDAQNVYVDDNQRLSSRPALQSVALPEVAAGSPAILELGDRLVDIQKFGSITVYVAQLTTGSKNYRIVAYNTEDKKTYVASFSIAVDNTPTTTNRVENYHICSIDHYIICFNNIDAKIFDTDDTTSGWQKFTDFAEVPVLKVISGTGTEAGAINQFIPDKYKEDYVWADDSKPNLPNEMPTDIIVNSKFGKFEATPINDLSRYTEYRLGSPINTTLSTAIGHDWYQNLANFIISSAHESVCIACDKYFYYSANYGKSFEKVYYPDYRGDFLDIAEVSKDGNYFFFVCTEGVFRCDLTSLTWSYPFRRSSELNGTPIQDDMLGTRTDLFVYNGSYKAGLRSCFLTGNVFCFELYDFSANKVYLYFKGPGLSMADDVTVANADHMTMAVNIATDSYYFLDYITDTLAWGTMPSHSLYDIWTMCSNGRVGFVNQAYEYNIELTTNALGKEIAVITSIFNNRVNQQVPGYSTVQPANILYIIGGDTSAITSETKMLVAYQRLTNFVIDSTYKSITYGSILSTSLDVVNNRLYINLEGENYNDTHYTIYNLTFNIRLSMNDWVVGDYTYNTLLSNITYKELLKFGQIYLTTKLDTIDDDNSVWYFSKVKILNSSNGSWLNEEFDTIFFGFVVAFTDDIFYVNADEATIPAILDKYNYEYKVWSNHLLKEDTILLEYTFGSASNYTEVPDVTYSDTELYLGLANDLKITSNTTDPDNRTKTLFNLPEINNQSFIDNITAMINISTTEVALFFVDKIVICSKAADENLAQGFRYDYYNTKLSTGVRLGDSVINTLEGSYTIFPTRRGLAAMNYQAFMATTDQVIAYLSDVIKEIWTEFYDTSKEIHIIQWRNRLVITNDSQYCLVFDIEEKAWWKWKVPVKFNKALSDQVFLQMIENSGTTDDGLNVFDPYAEIYFDHSDKAMDKWRMIEWFIMSQPLHFNQPNYYKNIKQLVFQLQDGNNTEGKVKQTIDAQVRLYRKKITTREPETIEFTIDGLRTFVKRFNYWKINELKWVLSYDENTASPYRFELNGVSVKYEIGDEVR